MAVWPDLHQLDVRWRFPPFAKIGSCPVVRIHGPPPPLVGKDGHSNYGNTGMTGIIRWDCVSDKHENLFARVTAETFENRSDNHLLITASRGKTFVFRKERDRHFLFHIVTPVEHLHCLRGVEGFVRIGLFEGGYCGILFTTARCKNEHDCKQRRITLSSQGRALTSEAKDTITSQLSLCLSLMFSSVPD